MRAERKPRRVPAPPDSRGGAVVLSGALVVAVATAASIIGIHNAFTQDDVYIIAESTRLHDFSAWRDVVTLPYWPPPASPDLYRPALSFLLALQYVLGGGSALMFRVVSYALYAAASVGVFRLARRFMPLSAALAAGVLFAAHPLHVEAVALAVAQNELVVGFLATLMVVRYVDGRRRGRLSPLDWAILCLCYIIASFSKDQGLVLPALLVAAELLAVDGMAWKQRVRELWPGYVALAAIGIGALAARTAVLHGDVAASITADALRGQGLAGRALTMLQIVPEWLRLFIWPMHLRAEYSPREFVASTAFGFHEALGLTLLLASIVALWFFRRRAPLVAFGIAWMAIALFPVSNVIVPTGILLAERTLFLPSIGFVLAAAGLAVHYAARFPLQLQARRGAIAATVAVFVALGLWRSVLAQRTWRDAYALTLASMKDAPRSWRVQQAFGEMMFDAGIDNQGSAGFLEAIRLAPETWRPRNRFAERLRMIGDDARALAQLRLSLAENPGRIETLTQLPEVMIAVGRYAEARQLADSIIIADDAPPVMLFLRNVADSAMAVNAPPGSIRVGVPSR